MTKTEHILLPDGPHGDGWDEWEIPIPVDGRYDFVETVIPAGADFVTVRYQRAGADEPRFKAIDIRGAAPLDAGRTYQLDVATGPIRKLLIR